MADLRCDGLAKSYGTRPVLSDVDLLVPEGTLTAILGASGSGKTTLLRLIVGFVAPDRGVVTIGGHVVSDAGKLHVPADKRAVGYVAQEGALFPHLSVAENVAFGLSRAERRQRGRVEAVLDLVGLDRSYADRRSHELSGGEQRRVALARALAPQPRLVLLDEPFSGLDAALRSETREAVVAALAAEGSTAVLVTHDQAEALSMGREVAVLRAGRLAQTASPASLYRTPVDLDVARFVGEAVVVPGHADQGHVDCALGHLEARSGPPQGPVEVMIRPEQIRLLQEPAGAGVSARVTGHRYYGPDTVLQLVLEGDSGLSLEARTFDAAVPAPGELVTVHVAGPVATYPAAAQSPHGPHNSPSSTEVTSA
jgi:iron(III) transport system ATP-binding protein